MSKSVIFFCDINSTSGYGHISRCRTISKLIRQRGFNSFLVVEKKGNEFKENDFQRYFDFIYEKQKFLDSKIRKQTLFIDSYKLAPSDEFLKHNWEKIILIRDSVTPNYLADLYLNQYFKIEGKSKSFRPEIFCPIVGSSYFKIGEELNRLSSKIAENILVFGGGSKASNFVPEVYSKLKLVEKSFNCTLLTNTRINISDDRFRLQSIQSDFHRILGGYDTVVSTSGSVMWELLAAKRMIGLGMEISNQYENFEFVIKNDLGLQIGEKNEDLWEIDLQSLYRLFFDPQSRKQLSYSMSSNNELSSAKKIFEIIDEII